jgi:hypothetical protein
MLTLGQQYYWSYDHRPVSPLKALLLLGRALIGHRKPKLNEVPPALRHDIGLAPLERAENFSPIFGRY